MIELRLLKKKDGTEVWQYRHIFMDIVKGYEWDEWTDVPVVEEE